MRTAWRDGPRRARFPIVCHCCGRGRWRRSARSARRGQQQYEGVDSERRTKRGCALQSPSTAVVKSTGAGDLTTSGSPVQNGRQRLPRLQNWGRIAPSGNAIPKKSKASCLGIGLLLFTGYRVNLTDQPLIISECTLYTWIQQLSFAFFLISYHDISKMSSTFF